MGTRTLIREPMSDEEQLDLLNRTIENLTNTLLATERSSDFTQPHGYLIRDAQKREMMKDAIDKCVLGIYGILTPSGVFIYGPGTLDSLEDQLNAYHGCDVLTKGSEGYEINFWIKHFKVKHISEYAWSILKPEGAHYRLYYIDGNEKGTALSASEVLAIVRREEPNYQVALLNEKISPNSWPVRPQST